MVTATRIDVTAGPDGRPRCLLTQGLLAARRLRSSDDDVVRVALVAAGALLLAGDTVQVGVTVEGPVSVEIIEPAGTVAYDMRGGSARWDVDVLLAEGARLSWHGEPFVVADGADVDRRTNAVLSGDSVLVLRELLVFGRSGEAGGTLRTQTRISSDGAPVLAEDLDLSPRVRAGWAGLRGHRCLETVTTVGVRLPDGPDVLQAEAAASVARWFGDEAHLAPASRAARSWQRRTAP